MTGTERYLLPVLGVCALAWLGLALYVLVMRIAHDAVRALLRARHRLVARTGERAGTELEGRLRWIPRRTLERAVANPTTPIRVAEAFAEHLLRRHEPRILREAALSTRRWRRVRALTVLVRGRSDAAAVLLESALDGTDEEVVAATVALLGSLGDRRSAEILVRALREGRFARARIAAQLDLFSQPIAQLLVPLLEEEDAQLRFWAATLLARHAGDTAVDVALTRAASDSDPSVRAAAVESLAVGGGESARSIAVGLLEDPVWFVRAHAARALRDLGGDTGPAIAPLLADESWWVRAAAKESLETQPGAALELMLDYLEHDDEFARNGAAEVLQNTGVLDSLLAQSGTDQTAVKRILAAGGRQLATIAAARNGLDPESLEQLAETDR